MISILGESTEQTCFVEYGDNAQIDCFEIFNDKEEVLTEIDLEYATPSTCQKACRENDFNYYGLTSVSSISCYCSSEFEFYIDFPRSTNCTSLCHTDSLQTCGGLKSIQVGSTNQLVGISLEMCKSTCFETSKCEAISYNKTISACHMRSTSKFHNECSIHEKPVESMFIESLEHYYVSLHTFSSCCPDVSLTFSCCPSD